MGLQADIVHHIPGRLRVKLPSLRGDAASLEQVREILLPVDGIWDVTVNPLTGSVLIIYDPQDDEFLKQLESYARENFGLAFLASESTTRGADAEARAAYVPAGPSEAARVVAGLFRQLDEKIKISTDNNLDLKTLLPLGLASLAVLKLGSKAATPMWLTLGIFAFSSFVALNAPSEAAQLDEQSSHDESGAEELARRTAASL
jgi:hypothetical protein